MSFKENLKKEFTTQAWVLIPIGVGINIVGSLINTALKLPLFLDSIGTILGGVLVGPWVGAVIGLLTNVILAIVSNPVALPYAIVNVIIGLLTGFFAKRGFYVSVPKLIIASFVVAVLSSLSAAPITAGLFGGVTGSGKDAITAYMLATGQNMFKAALTGDAIAGIADKIISSLLVFFIAKGLPRRYVDSLRSYDLK